MYSYTLRGSNLCFAFYLPAQLGSAVKRKERLCSLRPFEKFFFIKRCKRKSQKLSSIVKVSENHRGIPMAVLIGRTV